MQWLKYLSFAILGLVALAVTGLYTALHFIDQDQIKQLIVREVQDATSRNLTIDGPIKPSFSLTPTLTFHDIKLSNAEWANIKPMLTARELSVSFNLPALINGEFRITDVWLNGATLQLDKRGKRKNWDFSERKKAVANEAKEKTETETAAKTSQDEPFNIALLEISDSTIHYVDSGKKLEYSVVVKTLNARDVSDEHMGQLELTGHYKNAAFSITGRTADAMFLFEGALSKEGVKLDAKGSVSLKDLTFDAALNAQAAKLSHLMELIGEQSNDSTPVTFSTSLGGTDEILNISQINLTYDTHTIVGKGKLDLRNTIPFIHGGFKIASLNLSSSGGTPAKTPPANKMPPENTARDHTKQTPNAVESIIPDLEIPFDVIKDVHADVQVAIDHFMANDLFLTDLSSDVMIKDAKLSATNITAVAYKGTLTGSMTMNAAVSPPNMSVELALNHAAIDKMLEKTSEGSPITEGTLVSTLSLNGNGVRLKDILASANGSYYAYIENAHYQLPQDAAKTSEFFEALRGSTSPANTVVAQCAVTHVNVTNGVAKPDVLALKTDGAVVTGSGNVNFVDETMRIGFKARSNSLGFADVVPPLVIAGPMGNPSVTLDAQQNLFNIGKFAVGALTGVGLFAVLGEQVTDKLGITAENNPCLASIDEAGKKAADADANPKEAYKDAERHVRKIRDEMKGNVEGDVKQLEDDVRVIRDGLKGMFKKP